MDIRIQKEGKFDKQLKGEKKMLWQIEYAFFKNKKTQFTLKELCDTGVNAVHLEGKCYWKDEKGKYTSNHSEKISAKTLDTKVYLSCVTKDADGYTIIKAKIK